MSRTQPRRPAKQTPVTIAAGRAVEALERRVLFATYEWTGTADSLFSNAANWTSTDAPGTVPGGGDDVLTFPAAATNKTLTQDIANLAVTSVTFAGPGYTLGGANALALNGGDVNATHTTGTTTIDTDLTLAATADINPAAGGTVIVNGDVNNGGFLFRTIGEGDVTINGAISGAGGFTRTAGGNTTLNGENTYAGDTSIIAGGDLIVSDNPATAGTGTGGGDVTVAGALRGDGSAGDVTVTAAGDVFVGLPGTTPAPATLTVESLQTSTGSVLRFNVNGATAPGTDYDQLVVAGTAANDVVELGGVSLILDVAGNFTSAAGNTLALVTNAGTDPISGTSLNVTVNNGATAGTPTALADGGTVTIGTRTYTADFTGGDGNDFVLTDTTSGGGGGVNQAPVNTVPSGTQTVQVGEVLTFNAANNNAISVADPDAATADLLVTLTSTGGTINLATETGLNVTDADGDNSVVFTGTLAEINAALNGLTYTPGTAGSGTLTIATSDQGNTGTGGAQTDTDNVAITITPDDGGGNETNSPPVNTIPAAQTVATGQVLTFNTANNNVISVADPDAGTGPVQVTLTATNGTLNLASETGLTVTNPDGDASVAFTGPLTSVNAALNGLTFTPTAAGPATIQIVTNDQGNTGTGGAKSDTDTINITVGTAGTVQFDAANVDVNEGAGVATVTVTRSDTAAAASVDWAIATGGTATAGDDYVDGDDDTSGTVTFAPGAATATFLVAISDDNRDEANETINLALSNPTGTATLGERDTATITITDDDPTPTIRITDVAAPEGADAGDNLTFTVLLSAPASRPVTVAYATTGGTATAGQDYTNTTGTLTFAPGETSKEIEVPIAGDSVDEDTETFTVALTNATNATVLEGNAGTGTGTIVDDDGSQIGIFISDVVVTEGNEGSENVTFTVGISGAPTAGVNVTVDYATSNGTATAGEDYGARNGTLTFSGNTTEQTITVPVTGDGVVEALEAFALTLSNASNGELAVASAQGVIVNDDEPVGVSIDNVSVTEGDTGTSNATFTVTLSEASTVPLTVKYATADQSATQPLDYTSATGTLSFAAGETTKTITVPVVGDTTGEPTQTFVVTLSDPSNGLLLTDALGVGTIEDNDDGTPSGQATDDQVTRPQGTAPVTINVLANDTQFTGNNLTVTITDQPSGGTAVVNSDNTITYTPAAAGPALPDFLTYRVSGGGDSGTAQVSIFTTGAIVGPDPANPSQTALFVAGTAGADKINIGRKGTQLRVRSGREDLGLFDLPTGSVVVVGGDGDDRLAAGAFRGPVRLYGGNGNDRLNGGRFSDVLIGSAGDDRINGGAGRDIIIGGQGADRLNGAADEDIMIAGSSDYDLDTEDNRAALRDILAAWNGAAAYAARVTTITAPAGVGESGAGFNVSTTDDDTAIDRVNGGAGDDLFFANEQGGTAVDRVSGRRAATETLVDLTNNA